jgi:hypothetical protein
MAVADGTGDGPIWNPSKFALWIQTWGDSNNAPTSILLRHPTAPFPTNPRIVDTIEAIDDDYMQTLGDQYLDAVRENPNIHLPSHFPKKVQRTSLKVLLARDSGFFRWLPIGWPSEQPDHPNAGDPFVSFRVERRSPAGDLLDQTVILLASEWIPDHYLGSGFGIRVVAHVQQTNDKKYAVYITGMTASLPFGHYSTPEVWDLVAGPDKVFAKIFEEQTLGGIKTDMSNQLGLTNESVYIRGARIAEIKKAAHVEWRATSKPETMDGRTKATPYSFVFFGTPSQAGSLVSKVELVADATPGHAWVFPLDPASQDGPKDFRKRRPSRSERELDKFRDQEKITAGQTDPLIYPQPPAPEPPGFLEDMRVVVCPGFVLADDPPTVPGDPKTVDLPGTPYTPLIRSNDFAAISAYNNVRQFFDRLDAYGIGRHVDPITHVATYPYFRIANLPLKLYYRSGVRPGPGKDGQTVNASVIPEGWSVDYTGPTKLDDRPILEMHLALADRSTRARKPWNGTERSPAEPLGIAADARWIWHEIGHVLLMCSVGELEFRFAHSAGDALAAIVADPQSQLAADANWRGATFPWVFIPRRHDRCVSHGWSWGGSMHYALSQVPDSTPPRRKGYWTEQILSSSLFRLYRCIGGDTKMVGMPDQPDPSVRESASHYSVYLIMRGIQVLPISTTVLANEPDQLVSALIDADIGTIRWDVPWVVTFPPPPYSVKSFLFERVGGCVHKVIRWAFEAQGMYAVAGTITNAPGLPPHVDIYIPDLRPTSDATPYGDIAYGPGSYIPVSLDWDLNQSGSDVPPLWQADQNAIVVSGSNISVTVRNRGSQPAVNVQVSVWWCAWPGSTNPPKWNDPLVTWTQCSPPTSPGQTVLPDAPPTNFGPYTFVPPLPGTRYLVLAQATCGDDRANTDPASSLPCSQLPTRLIDLVANDNNLGLIVIENP